MGILILFFILFAFGIVYEHLYVWIHCVGVWRNRINLGIKKSTHCGPVVVFGATSIIQDGDEREGTIVLLFAPFAMRPGCEEKRVVGVMGYTLVSSIYE